MVRTYSDNFEIGSMEELAAAVKEFGFVPFFANEIEGFSLEEHIADGCWYYDSDPWDAWEWKGPVIRKSKCAYGKFLGNKAVYISAEWFPDFANYRRDGYDFDARYEDGLASYHDRQLYECIQEHEPVTSTRLKQLAGFTKGGKKGFDTILNRLMSECYVLTSDFVYQMNRHGVPYGWGIAQYATPETFFGDAFSDTVYKRSPEESRQRLVRHLQELFPKTEEAVIARFLRI